MYIKDPQQFKDRLRRLAVDHIRHGNTLTMQNIRQQIAEDGNFEQYLKNQAQPGTWGTQHEAMALADKLGYNLNIIVVQNGKVNGQYNLYTHQDTKATNISIRNENNNHFSYDNNTGGSGDCLYRSIAQAIADKPTKKAMYYLENKPDTNALNHKIDDMTETLTISHQYSIFSKANSNATPSLEEQDNEAKRISQLSNEQCQQIESDRKLALQLANYWREEEQNTANHQPN